MKFEAILADDITGAGDSGVHFAVSRIRTAILFELQALSEALRDHTTVALSSETRFLSPAEAAAAVRQIVHVCKENNVRVVFKKVDSTLRGNPGAEIEAILDETGYAAALVCPAMPKTGRVCRNGAILVNGEPLHMGESGRDPFNPVRGASIAEILAAQTSAPLGNIHLDCVRAGASVLSDTVTELIAKGTRIIIADAASDDDLAALGQLLRDSRAAKNNRRLLPVGAGGLAEAFTGGAVPHHLGSKPQGRMLAVVGSLTGVSQAQIGVAMESDDFFVLELDMEQAFLDPGKEIARLVAEAPKSDKRHLLLKNRTLPHPGKTGCISTANARHAAEIFAAAAWAICRVNDCSILYVTGGSIAVSVASAFGLRYLTLERECSPGIALCSCVCPGTALRWFISKAGGFGESDTIIKLASGMSQVAIR